MSWVRVEVPGRDPRSELMRAFRRAIAEGATTLEIVLDAELRASPEVVDALLEAASANTSLAELVIVHPSPSFGFLASTLQLRMRGTTVRAIREPIETSGSKSSPTSTSGDRLARTHVVEVDRYMAPVLLRAKIEEHVDAVRLALVFEASATPGGEMIEAIARALQSLPHLKRLALVHDSAAIGFFASSLRLRVPSIALRVAGTIEELEETG